MENRTYMLLPITPTLFCGDEVIKTEAFGDGWVLEERRDFNGWRYLALIPKDVYLLKNPSVNPNSSLSL